jgi:hypothetical protein
MAEILSEQQRKRFYFALVPTLFIRPRRCFQRIASSTNSMWFTPLFILSISVLINVLMVGRIKAHSALISDITFPPDYQYYSPEQQAQYMQAIQSTQGPVFTYVLPAITSLFGVWFGWLILGGLIHLATTLLGGRGSTVLSLNLVAWASLPLALRYIIQILYILITNRLIINSGLSGFSPLGESGLSIFVYHVLELVDIYLIWQILLLILGVRISTGLNLTKSIISVIIAVVIIYLVQAGFSYLGNILGNLNITRPFFF